MSDKKNGLAIVAKPKHKFNNKAEALGFARMVETYVQSKQQLAQAEALLNEVVDSLGIEGYSTEKAYNINLDTLELIEQ